MLDCLKQETGVRHYRMKKDETPLSQVFLILITYLFLSAMFSPPTTALLGKEDYKDDEENYKDEEDFDE